MPRSNYAGPDPLAWLPELTRRRIATQDAVVALVAGGPNVPAMDVAGIARTLRMSRRHVARILESTRDMRLRAAERGTL